MTSGTTKRTRFLSSASLGTAHLTSSHSPGGAEKNHEKRQAGRCVRRELSHPGGMCLEELRKTMKCIRVVDVLAENSRILVCLEDLRKPRKNVRVVGVSRELSHPRMPGGAEENHEKGRLVDVSAEKSRILVCLEEPRKTTKKSR